MAPWKKRTFKEMLRLFAVGMIEKKPFPDSENTHERQENDMNAEGFLHLKNMKGKKLSRIINIIYCIVSGQIKLINGPHVVV